MRAIALLCLLHTCFGTIFDWNRPGSTEPHSVNPHVCLTDQASCSCCLMQKYMYRMELFFNLTHREMNKELTKSSVIVSHMKASRTAFSVALNNEASLSCFGPFDNDQTIIYKHVFLSLGDGFNFETGIFTVPTSGVYSLSVTIYSAGMIGACASLQVNGEVVAALFEQKLHDFEDSSTIALAVELNAGDEVLVALPRGCHICDNYRHFNTFTGFLLYSTEYYGKK